MNDIDRALCAQMLNQLLRRIGPGLTYKCYTLIEDMITAAYTPYHPANEHVEWQDNCATDRYRYTAAGNVREVQVIATLIHYGVPNAYITVYTDKHTQYNLNIDLDARNVGTIQVKLAKIGTYGELFISDNDIKGSPEFVVYVDNANGRLYVVVHSEITQAINILNDNEEQSGLLRATWKHHEVEKGYYILNEYRNGFVVELTIPEWAVHSQL